MGRNQLLISVLALLTAGCVSQATPPAPTVNLSGFPLEFRRGYTDGCASGKPNAARQRDAIRFKADPNYAQGWRDGYDICGKR